MHIRRKIATILIGTVLLAGFAVAPGQAVVAPSENETTIVPFTPGTNCANPEPWSDNRFAGEQYGSALSGLDPRGVRANVYIPGENHFINCDPDFEGNDAASAWVSVEPGPNNTGGGMNADAIIQIGITVCNDNGWNNDICNYGGNPVLFWAWSGCNGHTAVGKFDPTNWGLPPVDNKIWYDLQISWDYSTDKWDFKFEGVQLAQIDDDDPYISCWAQPSDDLEVTWYAETWDQSDSVGSYSTGGVAKELKFHDMQWRDQTVTWNNFNSSYEGEPCFFNTRPTGAGRFHCWHPWGGNPLEKNRMWVVNNNP